MWKMILIYAAWELGTLNATIAIYFYLRPSAGGNGAVVRRLRKLSPSISRLKKTKRELIWLEFGLWAMFFAGGTVLGLLWTLHALRT